MNETIRITEDKLLGQLQKFNNKDITISFNGYVAEHIILHSIKVKKKDFTIILRSKATNELFCIDLCDISNIWKSTDDKKLLIFSESVGLIKIEIISKRYVTINTKEE